MSALSVFCAVFASLSYKMLFWTDRPLSMGSVLLAGLMSAAVAQLVAGGGGEGMDRVFGSGVDWVLNSTCAGAVPGGPVSIACVAVRYEQ